MYAKDDIFHFVVKLLNTLIRHEFLSEKILNTTAVQRYRLPKKPIYRKEPSFAID